MQITHLVGTLTLGGIQKQLLNFITTPPLNKFSHQLLCTISTDGELRNEIEEKKIKIKYLPFSFSPTSYLPHRIDKFFRKLFSHFYFIRFWHYQIKSETNIIHSHIYTHIISQIIATIFSGKYFIWTIHGEYKLSKMRLKIIQILLFIFKRKKIQITSVSPTALHKTLPFLKEEFYNSKIIYNGVDINTYSSVKNDNNFRKKYNISVDKKLIGSTGRIVWQKGYDQLLTLVKSFNFTKNPFHILIAGEGSLKEKFEKDIRINNLENKITFIGNIRNIHQFLAELDFYVQPSVTEGLCNSILEAMASGLPILCSDVEVFKELIQNEKNGLLHRANDIKSLHVELDKLMNLSKRDLKKLGLNAQITVKDKFSFSNCVDQYYNLYKHIKYT
jgi:glycosyltransferase involved in cell wall biosynthesis